MFKPEFQALRGVSSWKMRLSSKFAVDALRLQGDGWRSIFRADGFTLVELTLVLAIVSMLSLLVIPATSAMQTRGGLDRAATDIAGSMESARAYAMSNRTYVYVGLQEVSSDGSSSSSTGRVFLVEIASIDGIRPPFSDWGGAELSADVIAIQKPEIFDYVHLASASALTNGSNMTTRPAASFDLGASNSSLSFQWPLSGAAQNNFQKVVEFDPLGVARVQTESTAYDTSIKSYIEVPLLTAHGDTGANNSVEIANQAAVQVDGVTGAVRIYRP
jgi:prepilin-type N-terminal cleavage/methylation domain-containing protein